jgi:4-aminobutyrate aminotransferase
MVNGSQRNCNPRGYLADATGRGCRVALSAVTSADLLDRYHRVLPSFLNPYYAEPISIDQGQGSYVWDADGTRYLDFFGGVLTTMIGTPTRR